MSADLNDIRYDAFLANERTLDDPLVVTTEPNGRVRLRIINAAAASAFWIDLGTTTTATLIAVDGNDVLPIVGTRFPLAEAQRIDLLLTVPAGGPVPVLAQLEGSTEQTGVILAPRGSTISRVSSQAERSAEAVDPNFESKLAARQPLPDRPADRNLKVRLTGSMSPYAWGFDGGLFPNVSPLQVAEGERVAMRLTNETMMAHPIHLHGHHFQVVGINGADFRGAVRDTVLVPAMGSVDLAFDADNRGRWLLHCHNLYHMVTGMMTMVEYV